MNTKYIIYDQKLSFAGTPNYLVEAYPDSSNNIIDIQNYRLFEFKQTGYLYSKWGGDVSILLVGGGGNSYIESGHGNGGGGGGQVLYVNYTLLSNTLYTVNIGNGGQSSSIGTLTAIAGGNAGGGGGGLSPAGSFSSGHSGGLPNGTGGGGGAGNQEDGIHSNLTNNAGRGGVGIDVYVVRDTSNDASTYIWSGAGGGGGGTYASNIQGGGQGRYGGGTGGMMQGISGHYPSCSNGAANTGGGGGGASPGDGPGLGGSGICVIKYEKKLLTTYEDSSIKIKGGVESVGNGYHIHTFLDSSILTIEHDGLCDMLIVGGGGRGGNVGLLYPGGGGGGEVIYLKDYYLTSGTYNITIGQSDEDTVIENIITAHKGQPGTVNGGMSGNGFNGGSGADCAHPSTVERNGGGGGGATTIGNNAFCVLFPGNFLQMNGGYGATGGRGVEINITGISNRVIGYGGGGSGSTPGYSRQAGLRTPAYEGGGIGGSNHTGSGEDSPWGPGKPNTGGGGGGFCRDASGPDAYAPGGSGIFIIKYRKL